MNSFKKRFQKNDNQMASLKHSKSMVFGHDSEGRRREPPRTDPSKPVHRGKTPLNKSDIVYVEQAPGILDIHTLPPNFYDGPNRADLLAKFPHSPESTPGLPRSGFRAMSLNSNSIRPQPPVQNSSTSGQQAYPSIPRRTQRREATTDQVVADMLKTADGHTPILGSSRQAERIRAKSNVGRSYTPACPPPPPPVPTTHSPRPITSRSAHGSRVNIQDVPSHVATPFTPAPDHGQPHWPYPYGHYDAISRERDPEISFAHGRPLDAWADGHYHRIVDEVVLAGIVREPGIDWPWPSIHRAKINNISGSSNEHQRLKYDRKGDSTCEFDKSSQMMVSDSRAQSQWVNSRIHRRGYENAYRETDHEISGAVYKIMIDE
ncbi:hypothetical protein EDB19DRAFT_1954133 [Suillus lakei]|nr:hypothetical protein EDB19DRAFT_1954133 [Suillus lakei]